MIGDKNLIINESIKTIQLIIVNLKVERDEVIAFGIYTVSKKPSLLKPNFLGQN